MWHNNNVIQGVIFDVGGTLIYSNDDHFEHANAWAAATFLRARGFKCNPEKFAKHLEELRRTSPKGDAEFKQINTTAEHLQLVTGKFDIELSQELLQGLEYAFISPEVHGSVALPGIQEVVRTLQKQVRLGVISNTRSHVLIDETVKHLGLRDCFDPLVTSVSALYRKPSPHIFQAILDVWNVPPETLMMIGDAPSKDVVGAKAMGMKTIWLKTDATEVDAMGADKSVESARDILEALAVWM